ncbi:ABC transporter permease [Endothiovibrio diazotrophicus]
MKRTHPHWIAFSTLLRKEVRRFVRIWPQTVLPAAVTTGLYFVIFGRLIGSQISPIDGYRFIDYIVPGLIGMSVITNAYSNVVSSFFSAKMQRYVEELLVAPLPNRLILLGYVGGGVARGLAVGAAVAVVASLFTDLHLHSFGITAAAVLLSALIASLGGFINAIHAKTFDDISIIPTFILTPLTYLGGVFYSIAMLPGVWQEVSRFNPILYVVNAYRYGLLGVSDVHMGSAFAIIGLFVVVLYAYCLRLLDKGTGIRS